LFLFSIYLSLSNAIPIKYLLKGYLDKPL